MTTTVRFDNKSRTFDFFGGNSRYTTKNPYWINLNLTDTYPKLIGWLMHLSEKAWFTPPIMRAFVTEWSRVTGLAVDLDA